MKTIVTLALALGLAGAADAKTLVVCPAGAQGECGYRGSNGLQQAVDAASDGDVIRVAAGVYHPAAFRDVPFSDVLEDLTLRGFVVVRNKRLTIEGDDGAILDGSSGPPTIGMVIEGADVAIHNLVIRNFRVAEREDKIYDGHGIFAVNSRVRLDRVTLEHFAKMGLTGRGDTQIDARRMCVRDGHIAYWLHEGAYLNLRDSVARRNESSGVAAYDFSVAHVANSLFDTTIDDALYTEHDAVIHFTNGVLINNRPYAARALNNSLIRISHSVLAGNEGDTAAKDKAVVHLGADVTSLGKAVPTDAALAAAVAAGRDNSHLRKFGQAAVIGPAGQGQPACE